MQNLLKDLEDEASNLSTKSLGPIGFDYRRRTEIERLLFLIAKEYCERNLKYALGGLGSIHEKLLIEEMQKRGSTDPGLAVVRQSFELSRLISDLSSSDPYIREETLGELGGSVHRMLDTMSGRIVRFINEMRDLCNE